MTIAVFTQPATGSYPDPLESNPLHHTLALYHSINCLSVHLHLGICLDFQMKTLYSFLSCATPIILACFSRLISLVLFDIPDSI